MTDKNEKEALLEFFLLKWIAGVEKEEEEEPVGNFIFLFIFLCGIQVLFHDDSLELSLRDKTKTSWVQN